jgi:hypothetical protein
LVSFFAFGAALVAEAFLVGDAALAPVVFFSLVTLAVFVSGFAFSTAGSFFILGLATAAGFLTTGSVSFTVTFSVTTFTSSSFFGAALALALP